MDSSGLAARTFRVLSTSTSWNRSRRAVGTAQEPPCDLNCGYTGGTATRYLLPRATVVYTCRIYSARFSRLWRTYKNEVADHLNRQYSHVSVRRHVIVIET